MTTTVVYAVGLLWTLTTRRYINFSLTAIYMRERDW